MPVVADDPDERARVFFEEAQATGFVSGTPKDHRAQLASRSLAVRTRQLSDDAGATFSSGPNGKPKGMAVTRRPAAAFVDAEAQICLPARWAPKNVLWRLTECLPTGLGFAAPRTPISALWISMTIRASVPLFILARMRWFTYLQLEHGPLQRQISSPRSYRLYLPSRSVPQTRARWPGPVKLPTHRRPKPGSHHQVCPRFTSR